MRRPPAVLALVLAACGGADDDAQVDRVTTTTAIAATTTEAEATTTTSTSTSTTTTAVAATTTTTEAPPEPVVFDLAELPELISELDTAVTQADPLELAGRIGGFPYAIPVPAGSTIARVDTVIRADADVREHEFTYSVVAPGGTVPDVDITLDDNGPGSVAITEIWDPIMADLGFERANSTGSDPGDPGGPNSVNHVYVPTESAPPTVNGLPATPGNVFVWSSEDITGAASGLDPVDPVGGYRIDADADLAASSPLGVPLLAAIADLVPRPDGAELARATVRLETRSPNAFEIDRGVHYVSISFEWTATPGSTVDDVAAVYADGSVFRDDQLLPAEASFFEDGVYDPAEVGVYGDTDRRLPLLLLRRYEGTLWIEESSDPAEPVTISYDVALNPNDPELAPAAG